jgi:hypothetical protein
MERITTNGLTVYYDPEEREAAEMIQKACQHGIQTINTSWGLEMPEDCRVYVLTTWPRCVFQGAPLQTQILLGITMPFWFSEFKRRWQYAGGWAQRYGDRHVVGIKTPRLIEMTPESLGESIFIKEEDLEDKVLSIVCHELTHAFSSHLKLPTWLHEGLAMISSDRGIQKQTVRGDTLLLLKESSQKEKSSEKINLKVQSREEIVLIYVRGYWLTRYLAETQPELLKNLLTQRYSHQIMEAKIASGIGIKPEDFWNLIDERVVAHFEQELLEMTPVG